VAKHIGIVAVSPEGSALCYRRIAKQAAQIEDPDLRPLVTLHNLPFSSYVDAYRAGDWVRVGTMLTWSAQTLAAAGVDFLICPDNIAHHAISLAEASSPLPWLNMVELVADAVCEDNCTTLGLIGTRMMMQSSTYQTVLGLRGVTLLVPGDRDIERIDKIIFSELVEGRIEDTSRVAMLRVLDRLADRGCDGVVLASTETPLLLGESAATLNMYDPVRLLADHAIHMALNDQIPA
jgi:aspartate racemase